MTLKRSKSCVYYVIRDVLRRPLWDCKDTTPADKLDDGHMLDFAPEPATKDFVGG